MARSHDLELCGGAVLAATVRASVLMCDAANCACVSVVWYSAADILTQARRPTEPASLIDSPLYLHTGMSFVLRTPVRAARARGVCLFVLTRDGSRRDT